MSQDLAHVPVVPAGGAPAPTPAPAPAPAVAQVVANPPAAPVPGPPTGGQPPQGGPSGPPQAPSAPVPPPSTPRVSRWPFIVAMLIVAVAIGGALTGAFFLGRLDGERSAATQMAAPTAVPQPSAAPAVTAASTQVAVAVPAPTPATPAAPVATAPTVKPTQVPTATAAPTTEATMKEVAEVSQASGVCITTKETWDLLGLNVERLGSENQGEEPCSWVWRAVPVGSAQVKVSDGFIATLTLVGGRVVVTEDPGPHTIVAGTFRLKSGFIPSNIVHDRCALLASEQKQGQKEVPSFPVFALGFTCPSAG